MGDTVGTPIVGTNDNPRLSCASCGFSIPVGASYITIYHTASTRFPWDHRHPECAVPWANHGADLPIRASVEHIAANGEPYWGDQVIYRLNQPGSDAAVDEMLTALNTDDNPLVAVSEHGYVSITTLSMAEDGLRHTILEAHKLGRPWEVATYDERVPVNRELPARWRAWTARLLGARHTFMEEAEAEAFLAGLHPNPEADE